MSGRSLGKSGSRINFARCSDGDEKTRFRQAEINFFHEERDFPKPNDVWAEASRCPTFWAHARFVQIVFPNGNRLAFPAPRLHCLPVHVNDVAAARPLMQIINILSDHRHYVLKFSFQPRQGEMCRVGLCVSDFCAPHVVEFKNQRRIPLKSRRGRHIFDPVSLPQTACTAKCLNPRFG